MSRKIICILIFVSAAFSSVIAQKSQVLYYMNLPQNHLLNPALRPSNSVYVGIPALTGISVSVNNNFINFSDIIFPGGGDSLITFLHPDYNVDNFLAKIKEQNFISPAFSIQTLGIGFSAGKDLYFSIDVIDRFNGNFVVPGDLVRLLLKGNEEFVGKKINLSSFDADFQYFREYGLGFSKNITKSLRIGMKAKFLTGMMAASLENNSLGLTVNEDYTHTLNADLAAHLTYPFKVRYDSNNRPDSLWVDDEYFFNGSYLMNTKNMGFGIDIGATYSLGKIFEISAAVTDIGFIKWNDGVNNIRAESQFKFSGFNISDVISGDMTFDDLLNNMKDSLLNSFVFANNTSAFKTYLPMSFMLGGKVNISKSFSVGLLSQSIMDGNHFRQTATMSANLNLGNALSTSLSYTAANGRYDNLGAGLAFRLGFFQIYLVADRIPLMWDKYTFEVDDNNGSLNNSNPAARQSSFPAPDNWNTITWRLGFNLVMGNRVRTKDDKPMLMEQN